MAIRTVRVRNQTAIPVANIVVPVSSAQLCMTSIGSSSPPLAIAVAADITSEASRARAAIASATPSATALRRTGSAANGSINPSVRPIMIRPMMLAGNATASTLR